MKTNRPAIPAELTLARPWPPRAAFRWFAFIAAFALPLTGGLRADAPPTTVHIAPAGTGLEGLRNFGLQWNAVPNATYLLERADTLAPGSPWHSLDAVKPSDTLGSYEFSVLPTDTKGFYRLALRSQITAVEPAVVDVSVPNAQIYIIGQFLPANALVLINGLVFTPTIINSGGVWAVVSLNGLPPGQPWFDVTIVDPGTSAVVATLPAALLGVDASSPYLLEPPELPPAGPTGLMKAKEKANRTKCANNLRQLALSAGSSGIRENDNVVYEIQEGKKGLNAVNVKRESVAVPMNAGQDEFFVRGFSGEVSQQVVDLAISGRGLDFIWARTYNSRIGRSGAPNGWTFSYDVRCAQTITGDMDVFDGTGRKDTYVLQTNGTYTCPQFFREGTLNGGVFRLTFADTGYWEFSPLDPVSPEARLARIVDRNGNTMSLNYDDLGHLTQIVDDLGRTNVVGYDSDGRVASVTDFSGRTVTYQYYQGLPGEQGSAGDLKSVTSPPVTGTPNGNDFPTGKTTTYTYSTGYLDDRENHLLLSVIDATGQTISTHVYQHNQTDFEFLRCISVQHWTNTPPMLSYLPQTPTPANQFATLRCIVNDPVGDVTECFFDARNRPVKMQELTGRATPGVRVSDTANRPTVNVRPGDPVSYETRWSWNNDSLCTREVGPGGQQVQCVYESDFDPATRARKRADCRVVREIASSPVDLDGDGVAETTERAWRFEYDPRFGSSAKTVVDGLVKHRACTVSSLNDEHPGRNSGVQYLDSGFGVSFSRDKMKGTTGNPHGDAHLATVWPKERVSIDVLYPDICGFVTSVTDPRGNVTEGSYDAKGNQVQWQHHKQPGLDAPALDFVYNAHGELTSATHPADANGRRRVDTFVHAQGQVVECVEDAGAGGLALTTVFENDPRGNPTRCIDPRGNDWLCTYNALDQLVQTESPSLSGGSTGTYRIKTQFSYDANDNLTLVAEENRAANGTLGTNPFWRTQFVYDGAQRLTGCWRDKNGALVLRCTEVTYNAANQVVLYRSPEAVNGHDALNTVAFAYDERGLHYRTIAAPGSPVQSTKQCDYDANGNVTRVSEGLEGTPGITTMEYDGFAGFDSASLQIQGKGRMGGRMFSNRSSSTAPAIQGAIYTMFLPSGKPCRATASLGQERHARFDEAVRTENVRARLRSGVSHGSKGNTSIGAAYLGINRRSKITDPMGNVTTCNYDANDNLKVIRPFGQTNDVPGTNGNIRLAQSRYEYDGLDRPIRSRDSFFSLPSQAKIGDGERTTTFAYAPNSECTSITDDLGRVTTFGYDTAGRHLSTTKAETKTITAVFRDQAGNVTQTTQTDQPDLGGPPQVFAWASVYDALNRRVSTTDNVGNSRLFAYDSRDNCTSTTDPNGNETVYAYDGLSRQVSFTIAQGAASSGTVLSSGQSDYDDNDRCISSTDANGNVTLHAYDSLDRLTQTTQADGTHHSLVWSPRSNLISETDANGTVITHTYDLNDRRTASHITPGSGVAATTLDETFAYDGASRLVSANNDTSQSGFEYDSLGNCTRGVSGGVGAVVSPHDSMGRRTSLTYPGGRVLTYAYDVLDQCTNINENGAALASFSYAGPGRVARVIYGNGTRAQVTYDGIADTPNAIEDFGHGQIRSVTHAIPGAGGPQSFAAVSLKWDRNGNKILRSDTIFAPAIPRTNNLGLQYDGADRLTRATVISDVTVVRDTVYGLDLMGNRTNVTGAASCSGSYFMDGFSPGPMDFQMNQYTATPCDSRTYDENGNLASRSSPVTGPVIYQYDYAGRLVQVQALDFNSGALAPVASYAYDAMGRRISKTINQSGLPPVTTQFIYDGGGLIEERVNDAVAVSYVHATGLKEEIRENDSVVFEMRQGTHDYYYHTDDQGNVLALSGANGVVAERYYYDDYGAVTFLTSDGVATTATSSAVGNAYCWGGLCLDAETGLQNNDGGGYVETQSGATLARAQDDLQRTGSIVQLLTRNNPWSGGGGSPSTMQKGTVKFFNEAKGFGMVTGGGGRVWPRGGYWSVSGRASNNITMKGQKIMQN